MNFRNNLVNSITRTFSQYLSLHNFHLLDNETKQKPNTKVTAVQPKPDKYQIAQGYTITKTTATKMDDNPKYNIISGMFRQYEKYSNLKQFIFTNSSYSDRLNNRIIVVF